MDALSLADSLPVEFCEQFQMEGTVLLPPFLLFSRDELTRLELLLDQLPEETISDGDDESCRIFVRRLMIDRPGSAPTRVDHPCVDQILALIDDSRRQRALGRLLGSDVQRFVRRCQMHRLNEGGSIGLHLDAESNPDNEVAVIVQFGKDFSGGEFVVHPADGDLQIFRPDYGSVIVTTCALRHEVWRVAANERKSLNYFYSRHNGENRRDLSARCSRPDCKWCGSHLRSQTE